MLNGKRVALQDMSGSTTAAINLLRHTYSVPVSLICVPGEKYETVEDRDEELTLREAMLRPGRRLPPEQRRRPVLRDRRGLPDRRHCTTALRGWRDTLQRACCAGNCLPGVIDGLRSELRSTIKSDPLSSIADLDTLFRIDS